MSERGVFAVDRGIWNDPDFAPEPLTEREAFLWLVGEAAWKPHVKRVGSRTFNLNRGQVAVSVRFLADAWRWSKSRVHRYLGKLKKRDIIASEDGTAALVITIRNYNRFQRVSLPERDSEAVELGTAAGQQRDKLEDKEDKEYSIADAIEPSGSKPANDLDPKAVYWRELTEELVTLLEKPETACRKVLGRLLSTAHSESEIVRRAILDASYHQPADPVPWMISRIQNMQQRPRAGPNGHQPRPKTGQEEFFDAIKRVTGQ